MMYFYECCIIFVSFILVLFFKFLILFLFQEQFMFIREREEKGRNGKALMSSCTQTTTINT